jgi:hypothetical protein
VRVDVLQDIIAELVRRHDALRTRIVMVDGVPTQRISESERCDIEFTDLKGVSEALREAEVQRSIRQLILEPIDLAVGPLVGMRLVRLGDEEHVLIIVMEHVISDAFSMNILLRELFTSYGRAMKGLPLSLPAVPIQFTDYAMRQRHSQSAWLEKHGAYWHEHLKGCQRLRFPGDPNHSGASQRGWGTVSLRIGRDLKAELLEWCRIRRTTLVMSVFTAYSAAVLRWCRVSDAVVLYQTDGRFSPDLENTIGYVSSVLYLRMELRDDDTFVGLMSRVIREYCNAYEHADSSCMEARVPAPGFTRNSRFNWVPQGTIIPERVHGPDAIAVSPVCFAHPMRENLERDTEPSIQLFESGAEIIGELLFPLNRFSRDTMERFGRHFLALTRALLSKPEGRVCDIALE